MKGLQNCFNSNDVWKINLNYLYYSIDNTFGGYLNKRQMALVDALN